MQKPPESQSTITKTTKLYSRCFIIMVQLMVLTGVFFGSSGWSGEEWNVAYKVTEPDSIRSVRFSDDDRFLLVHYVDFSVVPAVNNLDIRNAETGERVGLLSNPNGSRRETRDSFQCQIRGSYALLCDSESHQSETAKLFNWETRAELPLQEKVVALGVTPVFFVLEKNSLEVPSQMKQFVLSLPGLETVAAIAVQSSDRARTDRWFAVLTYDGNILINHFDTKKTEKIAAATSHGYFVGYAKTNDILLLRTENNEGFQVIDVGTGKSMTLAKMDMMTISPDGKTALAMPERDKPLQVISLPTGQLIKQFERTGFGEFRPDGSILAHFGSHFETPEYELLDARDYSVIWKKNVPGTRVENPNFLMMGARVHTQDSRETDWVMRPMSNYVINPELVDAQTGTLIFDFKSDQFRNVSDRDSNIHFANSHPAFAVWADDGVYTNGGFMGKTQSFKGSHPGQNCAMIWRRTPSKR